jgi:hypothetical protein
LFFWRIPSLFYCADFVLFKTSIQEGEEEDSSFPRTTSEDAECTTIRTDNTSRQESTHHRGPINKSRVTLQNSFV